MTSKEILAQLEKMGSPSIKKVYLKHGAVAVGLVARNAEKLQKVVEDLNNLKYGGKVHAI